MDEIGHGSDVLQHQILSVAYTFKCVSEDKKNDFVQP